MSMSREQAIYGDTDVTVDSELTLQTSGVVDGDMSLNSNPEHAMANREAYLHKLGIEDFNIVHMQAVHGAGIAVVRAANVGNSQRVAIEATDAIIVYGDVAKYAVTLAPADCIPLSVASTETNAFGLAHLGWKELNQDLAQEFVETFCRVNAVSPESLSCIIGPSIRKESYGFPSIAGLNKDWQQFIRETGDTSESLDMASYLYYCLGAVGVAAGQVSDSKEDTAAPDSSYFSHYRATRMGQLSMRNLCVAYRV